MNKPIPYDPDFDTPPRTASDVRPPSSSPKSIFDSFGPRRSFIIGFAVASMLLANLGFIVLAQVLLTGKFIAL